MMSAGKGSRVSQIAQSEKWTVLSRLASIAGGFFMVAVVVPLVGWMAYTTYTSSVALSDHGRQLTDVQATVSDIKAQDGKDHDALTILRTEMDGALVQIQKLWERPQKPPQP